MLQSVSRILDYFKDEMTIFESLLTTFKVSFLRQLGQHRTLAGAKFNQIQLVLIRITHMVPCIQLKLRN